MQKVGTHALRKPAEPTLSVKPVEHPAKSSKTLCFSLPADPCGYYFFPIAES
jgi:hypothetical protein